MSDEKTPPAAPVLGAGDAFAPGPPGAPAPAPGAAPAPLTFRGRAPMPGAYVPAITPPGGLAPITPTMPVLERALLPLKPLPPPPAPPPAPPDPEPAPARDVLPSFPLDVADLALAPPPVSGVQPSLDLPVPHDLPPAHERATSGESSGKSSRPPPLPDAAFAPPPPPGMPAPPSSFEELDHIDDDGTPVPITLPSASLDGAAQSAAGVASVVTPAPIQIAAPPPAHLAPEALGLPETPAHLAPQALPLPEAPALAAPALPDASDAEPASKPPSSSSRRQIAIAPDLPQIPKPVSSRPIQHAPGIVSTQAIPLMVPARRGRSPLAVALVFAIVGSAAALAVFLLLRPGTSAEASGSGDPAAVTPPPPATEAPAASSAPAPAPEPATAAPVASSAPAAATGAPAPTAAVATSSASAARPGAPQKPTAAPAAPAAAVPHKQKSDRIED